MEQNCKFITNSQGTFWYNENGQYHRVDGPACEYEGGSKYWYQNGKLHRADGPAIEDANYKVWYLNGLRHRVDGPACEYTNYKAWYQNGKLHRVDGPAYEYANGDRYWYLNDKLHRIDGPACEYEGGTKFWYIEGVKYTEEQFNAKINIMVSSNIYQNIDKNNMLQSNCYFICLSCNKRKKNNYKSINNPNYCRYCKPDITNNFRCSDCEGIFNIKDHESNITCNKCAELRKYNQYYEEKIIIESETNQKETKENKENIMTDNSMNTALSNTWTMALTEGMEGAKAGTAAELTRWMVDQLRELFHENIYVQFVLKNPLGAWFARILIPIIIYFLVSWNPSLSGPVSSDKVLKVCLYAHRGNMTFVMSPIIARLTPFIEKIGQRVNDIEPLS